MDIQATALSGSAQTFIYRSVNWFRTRDSIYFRTRDYNLCL